MRLEHEKASVSEGIWEIKKGGGGAVVRRVMGYGLGNQAKPSFKSLMLDALILTLSRNGDWNLSCILTY